MLIYLQRTKVPKIDGVGDDRNVKPAAHITTWEEMLINGHCQENQYILRGRSTLKIPIYHRERNSTKEILQFFILT